MRLFLESYFWSNFIFIWTKLTFSILSSKFLIQSKIELTSISIIFCLIICLHVPQIFSHIRPTEKKKFSFAYADNAKIVKVWVTHNPDRRPPTTTEAIYSNNEIVPFNPFKMALRISAKRVAATLKSSSVSSSPNGTLKRNASQATAAVTNLSEGVRNEIYVSLISHSMKTKQLADFMFCREKYTSPTPIHRRIPQPQLSWANKHLTW